MESSSLRNEFTFLSLDVTAMSENVLFVSMNATFNLLIKELF